VGGQSGIRVCNGGGGGGASVAPQAHLRIPCVNNLRYRVSSHVTSPARTLESTSGYASWLRVDSTRYNKSTVITRNNLREIEGIIIILFSKNDHHH